MNIDSSILNKYFYCLKCGASNFETSKNKVNCKKCGGSYNLLDNNIIQILPEMTEDLKLSIEKWDAIYQNQLADGSYSKEYDGYKKMYLKDTIRQLNESKLINKSVYLEIGCGQFFLGQSIANDCAMVIGVDICPSALKIAKKMLESKGIKNYLLIHGDIKKMPIKKEVIDLIYGGGVIEHFKNTGECLSEIYRVLKNGGVSFNTVPYLNIGSLTYRQIWGNIPNLPVLRQLAELIHIRMLKGKHMIFGYEFSFTAGTLKRIHYQIGFSKVKVSNFEVEIRFEFMPKFIRRPLIYLAKKSRLFWPMVKVVAEK